METRYPIYVPSKGRWNSCITMRMLNKMSIPYRVVVEDYQFDKYAEALGEEKILSMPRHDSGLHTTRNWIWEHAKSEGHKRFWQLDDNIRYIRRLHLNMRINCEDATPFRVVEDFVDRYTNVAQAGLQYSMFAPSSNKNPPFVMNTRIYSCTLNLTELPFRYRHKYNDDTDLSLQCLKAGWVTLLFNAFTAEKIATMLVGGGNTGMYEEGGDKGGRLEMAQALVDLHPDIVTISKRFNRYQHKVDYRPFKANLLRKLPREQWPKSPTGEPTYGLTFERRDETTGEWSPMNPKELVQEWEVYQDNPVLVVPHRKRKIYRGGDEPPPERKKKEPGARKRKTSTHKPGRMVWK